MNPYVLIAALGVGLLAPAFGPGPTAVFAQPGKAKPGKPAKGKPDKQKLMHVNGTVTGVTSSELVLTGRQKGQLVDLTFVVAPTTQVRKGGQPVTIADVWPGSLAGVRYASDLTTGVNTAQFIRVRADQGLDDCEPLTPTPVPQ